MRLIAQVTIQIDRKPVAPGASFSVKDDAEAQRLISAGHAVAAGEEKKPEKSAEKKG